MTRIPGLLALPVAIAAAGFQFVPDFVIAADAAVADESIDQIVVVAHKDERSIRQIAANVTSVDRETLTQDLAVSTSDLFQYVPGVDYEAAGTRFGTEGINIRGIGGNRVAILVDGVPLSDQFDVGSFSNATRDFIDSGLIQSIEVLHGPASALYGSSAVGGVVAVRTPDPVDFIGQRGVGGEALVTYREADESQHGQAMVAYGSDSKGLVLGGSYRDGGKTTSAAAPDRIDSRDYERTTALAKFLSDDRFGHTWRFSVMSQRSKTLSDLNSLLGAGRYRSTTALEGDDSYTTSLVNISWEFGSPESWIDSGVVRAFFQTADIEQSTLDERANARTPVSIDRFFSFEQDIVGVEVNLWKDLGGADVSHRLGLGFEYQERETEEYRDGLSTNLSTGDATNVLLGEVFPLRDFPISTTNEIGVYVEDTIKLGDWTVIAALRADSFELSPRNDDVYVEDYPFAQPVSIDESELSPKLGVIYRVSPAVDVYAQYSHGFRAPPYADANISLEIPFFNYRAIPNPDLKSESSDGFDLGIRVLGVDTSAQLSAFYTRYSDFIESKVRVGTDPLSGRLLFQSQNLEATHIEGLEGSFTWQFGGDRRAFLFDAAAYWAQGENKETGEALNSVGPAQAVVGLSWFSADGSRQLRLKTTLTDAWDKRDESRADLFKPGGHAVYDLYLTQSIGQRATIRAGLQNLTDKTYWHWSDVRGLSADDPMIPYLSRAGRSASVSLNVIWQ